MAKLPEDELRKLALKLRLYGLLANWGEIAKSPWVPKLLEMERAERARRSHEYRLKNAKIGAFKDRSEFDWKHPTKADRLQIDELFTLDFIGEGTNVVFVGPNGIGKTMLARNLAYEAVSRGVSTRYTSASDMLAALGGLTGSMLTQRLRRYTKAALLVVDELGYLRYDSHLADLLYEVISRRYDAEASTIITTNKPFSEWNQVFEGAACVSTMIDRLCHRVELVKLEGKSYRAKEAASLAKRKRAARTKRPPKKPRTTAST
ncbi:MAG: ATP-binding protein [Nannocystales bacterium]